MIAVLAVRAALGAILGDLSVASGASAPSVPGATGIRSMVLQWRSRSICSGCGKIGPRVLECHALLDAWRLMGARAARLEPEIQQGGAARLATCTDP